MREVVYLFNALKNLDRITVRDIKAISKEDKNLNYFKYGCGATKNVFIGKEWVLKYSISDHDEAYQEYLIYQDAKNKGLEMFFPETVYAGEINGIKFVYQKKIDIDSKSLRDDDVKFYSFFDKITKAKIPQKKVLHVYDGFYNTTCSDFLWINMCILLYGYKKVRALEKFTRKHKINDLHRGNLGYLNNKPIILDFCGFHR